MAAPMVVLKTAQVAHSLVQRWVPGGWKTVIVVAIIVPILLRSIIISAIFSFVPSVNNIEPICASNSTQSDGGTDDHGDNGSGGGTDTGYGKHKAPNVPFPTTDSSTIVIPTKGIARSSYGPRAPIQIGSVKTNAFHDGTDFGAGMGTPIVAMSDGIVSMAKRGTGTAEGSMVEIQHLINGKKYTTAYRHVQGKSIKVNVGDTVKAGQQIASVGSEGYSTGPHLHFVVAQGPYHRYNSANGPAGTVNAQKFLASNGAVDASGGITGDDFSGGVNSDDPSTTQCAGDSNSNKLPGDGTTEWGGFENGEFDDSELGSVGKFKLYKEGADQLKAMLEAYKKDKGVEMKIKTAYLSKAEQKKLYDADKQLEKPGESIFGYARIVQLDFKNDFESKEYKWLQKNAGSYGFEQPQRFVKNSTNKDARIWSYNGSNEFYYQDAGGNAKANQELARKVIKNEFPEFDNPNEFKCLVQMWMKESSWNHKAANPVSSARGIPQAMMSLHFGKKDKGPSWKTDPKAIEYLNTPEVQIRWGLNYIKSHHKYKTPCGAWNIWQNQGNY